MSVLGQSLNLVLSSILTILLTCPSSDTLCYSNDPFLNSDNSLCACMQVVCMRIPDACVCGCCIICECFMSCMRECARVYIRACMWRVCTYVHARMHVACVRAVSLSMYFPYYGVCVHSLVPRLSPTKAVETLVGESLGTRLCACICVYSFMHVCLLCVCVCLCA